MSAPRLSNVILLVSDPERSVRFYRDVLGLTLRGAAGEFSFFAAGTVALALRRHTGEIATGSTEIVLEVDDIRAAYDELSSRGVEFRVEPREVTRLQGCALLASDFRDPDGHVLSITGWVDITD